jgi:uncharacterized membrane protein YqjE
MESPRPTLGEVMGASKRMAQRAVDIGSNRLELLIVELHEERDRLLLTIIMALGAAALALLAGFAFTLAIMVLLWDRSPGVAMAILTVLYAAGAAFLVWKVLQVQRTWEMFASSLDQLRKDREALTQNF